MTDPSAQRSDRTAERRNAVAGSLCEAQFRASNETPASRRPEGDGYYYGVEDAAETRSSGVGTRPGFRFTSTGTAGISSGPSAGGAGSSAFSMLAYFAAIL
jgi:hypothetical protein